MNDAAVIGLAFAIFCTGVTVFFVSRKRLKEQRYRGDKIDLVFAPIETLEIELADLTDQYQEWFSGKGKMYDGDEAIITYQLTNTVVTMPDSKVTLEVFYQVESGGYCQ